MNKVKLYPHNKEAYKKIEQSIANGDKKLAISHATGTGKSYLIAKLCEDYNSEKKLVLVPSTYIKEAIQLLLQENNITNVDVKLYQGLIRMTDEEISAMDYKVVALDEYHHDTAKVWGSKVKTLIDSHPETIFFGTSATPIRTDGINTIDELFDGNCVSNLSLPKAIVKKIAPRPKYVAALYTLDERLNELRKKVEKSTNSKEEKEEFYKKINSMRSQIEKSYGMPIILNNQIKDKEGKFIVFCKNKTHLKQIKNTVIEWFKVAGFKNINSYVVHSSYEEKDKEYQAFCDDTSHNLKLLFCVNMLNEGLHLENISGVLLLRNTSSYIVLMQQIGRAIEASNTNTPIIIDAVNNFSYIKDGIKLLTEIKESIIEEKQINKDFDDSDFIDIDMFFVTEYVCDIENLLNEIEEKLQNNWELYIKALLQYKNREGDCLVPSKHEEIVGDTIVKLGIWCSSMRRAFKGAGDYSLSDEKIKMLDELGFVWDFNKYNFELKMKSVHEYFKIHGCYPSQSSVDLEEKKLGQFYNSEKVMSKKGKSPKWKTEIMKKYSMSFSHESRIDKSFKLFLHYLRLYQEKYGHTNIKSRDVIDDYNIGKTLAMYKQKYKKGDLPLNIVDELKNINCSYLVG